MRKIKETRTNPMIYTIILLVYCLINKTEDIQNRVNFWRPRMDNDQKLTVSLLDNGRALMLQQPNLSVRTDDPNPNRHLGVLHPSKREGLSAEQLQALNVAAEAEAAEAAALAKFMPSYFVAKEIGEISEKTNGLRDENNRLRDEIKALRKEIEALAQKNETMKSQNQKLHENIRVLESSREKLQKELERVKTANDTLRIEIEEKTAKNSKENQILKEEVESLTLEFEAVESENEKLKRSLEELTHRLAAAIDSNNSLKQTVDSISEENQQLKDEFANLKADNQDIRKTLECKDTRLVLGQVAWLLEKEIWTAVLPNKQMGTVGILRSMKQWLKKNSSKPEGKEAQKRWDDLKAKLNWDDDEHTYGLKQLKDLRIKEAHPDPVDLEVARKELKKGDFVADTDKEIFEEIIDMVIKARKLNSSMQ